MYTLGPHRNSNPPNRKGRLSRKHNGAGNPSVQRCEQGLVFPRKLKQVAVRKLSRRLGESRQPIGPKRIANQFKRDGTRRLECCQSLARRPHVRLQARLHRHADETQFRNSARADCRVRSHHRAVPCRGPGVMDMGSVAKRDQSVYVQEMLHGKSANMARTSSLVTVGPLVGPFVIVRPVDGSRISFGLAIGGIRGVRTIAPFVI